MKMDNLCITQEKVNEILSILKSEDSYLTNEMILKAIESCCKSESDKNSDTFLECIRERAKIFKLI